LTQTKPQIVSPESELQDQTANVLLSHDIRAALSQILHAGQALEGAGLGEDHGVYLQQINAAALYINELLETVSKFADMVPVSEIDPLLVQLETVWRPEAAKKGLGFSVVRKGILPGSIRLPG